MTPLFMWALLVWAARTGGAGLVLILVFLMAVGAFVVLARVVDKEDSPT